MFRFTHHRVPQRATAALILGISLLLAGCDDAASPATSRSASPAAATAASRAADTAFPARAASAVSIDVFAPEDGHRVGIGGAGWFVDLEMEFPNATLAQTGFTGFQLTGPGGHNNIAPFPRPGAPGHDESNPSLLVVCSSSVVGAGAGQNLAGLMNLTGVTNQTSSETELWATWILAGPACGANTKAVMAIGVVDDIDGNGIYDDAPDVVSDANGDGRITLADVRAIRFASNLVVREFFINP